MTKGNKVVYLHRKATDNTVFYVGIGNPDRPKSKERSIVWHRTVNKHGYTIEVIHKGLTKEEACSIEIDLIELIGRRDLGKGTLVNLTDGGEGFTGVSQLDKEKRIICLNTGVVYKSIKECSKATGIAHSSISGFLNKPKKTKRKKNKELNFRFLDGNNIVWKPEFDDMKDYDTLPLSEDIDLIDYDYNYDLDSLTENRIMLLAKSFDRLNIYSKMILYLNSACDMSLRDIAKSTGIGLTSIHQHVIKSISTLSDNNNPFIYQSKQSNFDVLKKLFDKTNVKDDYGIKESISKSEYVEFKPQKKSNLTIRLESTIRKQAEAFAEKNNTNLSEVIRYAAELLLDEENITEFKMVRKKSKRKI